MDVYGQVQRHEGTAGLYRGFLPSCLGTPATHVHKHTSSCHTYLNIHYLGVILYRGLYFGLYDSLKPIVLRGKGKDSTMASFMLGWGITLGAGLATYPLDTISRRMMTSVSFALFYTHPVINFTFVDVQANVGSGLVNTLKEIVEHEGLIALWKGAAANVAYALIGASLLVAYDLS
jgi:solute carrier family 25 (adenine nucleotide translocator) protein 4/5/6/31